MKTQALRIEFNTSNMKWSLVVAVGSLEVHTEITIGQAEQIRDEIRGQLGWDSWAGQMGTVDNYNNGNIKNTHELIYTIKVN